MNKIAIIIVALLLGTSLHSQTRLIGTARTVGTAKTPTSGGGGAISIVQSCSNGAFQASSSCSLGTPTTGHQLVVWEIGNASGASLAAPTTCASDWTSIAYDSTTTFQRVWLGTANAGACTISISNPGTGFSINWSASELSVSSVTTDAPAAFSNGTLGGSFNGASTTVGSSGSLAISWTFLTGTSSRSINSPWTSVVNSAIGSNWYLLGDYAAPSGAYSAAMPMTIDTGNYFNAIIALKSGSGFTAKHIYQVTTASSNCGTSGTCTVTDSGTTGGAHASEATVGSQPTYVSSAINSQPGLDYGTDGFANLTLSSSTGSLYSGVAVFKVGSTGFDQWILNGASGALTWRINSSNHQELVKSQVANICAGTTTFSAGSSYAVAFTYDSSTGACAFYRCSGGTCTSDGTATNVQTITAAIGALGGFADGNSFRSTLTYGAFADDAIWSAGNLTAFAQMVQSVYGF